MTIGERRTSAAVGACSTSIGFAVTTHTDATSSGIVWGVILLGLGLTFLTFAFIRD